MYSILFYLNTILELYIIFVLLLLRIAPMRDLTVHPSLPDLNIQYLVGVYLHGVLLQYYEVSHLALLEGPHYIVQVALPGRVYGHGLDGLVHSDALFGIEHLPVFPHLPGRCVVDAAEGVHRLAVEVRVQSGSQSALVGGLDQIGLQSFSFAQHILEHMAIEVHMADEEARGNSQLLHLIQLLLVTYGRVLDPVPEFRLGVLADDLFVCLQGQVNTSVAIGVYAHLPAIIMRQLHRIPEGLQAVIGIAPAPVRPGVVVPQESRAALGASIGPALDAVDPEHVVPEIGFQSLLYPVVPFGRDQHAAIPNRGRAVVGLREQREVQLRVNETNAAVVQRCATLGRAALQELIEVPGVLLQGHLLHFTYEQIDGQFLHFAGQLAIGAPNEATVFGVLGAAVEAQHPQGCRVDMCDMTIRLKYKNANCLADLVQTFLAGFEIARRDLWVKQLPTQQVLGVGTGHRLHQFVLDLFHVRVDVGPQIQPMVDHAKAHMNVGVNEARQQSPTLQVDDLSVGPLVLHHLLECPYLDYQMVPDGDGLSVGVLVVHGVDAAVDEYFGGLVFEEVDGDHLGQLERPPLLGLLDELLDLGVGFFLQDSVVQIFEMLGVAHAHRVGSVIILSSCRIRQYHALLLAGHQGASPDQHQENGGPDDEFVVVEEPEPDPEQDAAEGNVVSLDELEHHLQVLPAVGRLLVGLLDLLLELLALPAVFLRQAALVRPPHPGAAKQEEAKKHCGSAGSCDLGSVFSKQKPAAPEAVQTAQHGLNCLLLSAQLKQQSECVAPFYYNICEIERCLWWRRLLTSPARSCGHRLRPRLRSSPRTNNSIRWEQPSRKMTNWKPRRDREPPSRTNSYRRNISSHNKRISSSQPAKCNTPSSKQATKSQSSRPMKMAGGWDTPSAGPTCSASFPPTTSRQASSRPRPPPPRGNPSLNSSRCPSSTPARATNGSRRRWNKWRPRAQSRASTTRAQRATKW